MRPGTPYELVPTGLGAVSTGALFDFQAAARKAASLTVTPFVFVGFGAAGSNPVVQQFGSRSQLADTFDAFASNPGQFAYIAMFDKSSTDNAGLVDEARFTGVEVVETRFTFNRFKKNLPFILGGLALVAGAVLYTKQRKKQRRAGAGSTMVIKRRRQPVRRAAVRRARARRRVRR